MALVLPTFRMSPGLRTRGSEPVRSMAVAWYRKVVPGEGGHSRDDAAQHSGPTATSQKISEKWHQCLEQQPASDFWKAARIVSRPLLAGLYRGRGPSYNLEGYRRWRPAGVW